MPSLADPLGALSASMPEHVLVRMTTASTETKAVNTSSAGMAAIAPTFSALEEVLAVAPPTGVAYASPIRVTSHREPRRSRYSSSRYRGPLLWSIAIARPLLG